MLGCRSDNPTVHQFGYNANALRIQKDVSRISGNTRGRFDDTKAWHNVSAEPADKRRAKRKKWFDFSTPHKFAWDFCLGYRSILIHFMSFVCIELSISSWLYLEKGVCACMFVCVCSSKWKLCVSHLITQIWDIRILSFVSAHTNIFSVASHCIALKFCAK